jgi:hypothetical protein
MDRSAKGLKGEPWLHALVFGTVSLYQPGSDSRATAIKKAIRAASQQKWSIVLYQPCSWYGGAEHGEDGEGRVECNGWHVFGYRNTGSTTYSKDAITKYVKREFGWCSVGDLRAFQESLEEKVNEQFGGRWRVHVVKGANALECDLCGIQINIDGITCLIMNVA